MLDSMYDHRYERPLAMVVDACTECGEDIYEGETYYTFGVVNVCEDCIDDYVG